MCAQQSTVYRTTPVSKEEDSVNLREVFQRYTYHWPLFILFFVISMTAALFYFKVKKPSYDLIATLQIQDDSKDNSKANDNKSALDELNLMSPPKLVENEMEILKSVSLVNKVVYDLKLWVNYTHTSKLVKEQNLYKHSPVDFILVSKNGILTPEKFTIVIKDKNTFLIKRSDGKFTQFKFGQLLQNGFGSWQLIPTSLVDDYIGSTVNITLMDPEVVGSAYQSALKVDLVDKLASTVSVSVADQVPDRGKDFLNDLIKRYDEANREEINNLTQNTLDFIDNRLKTLQVELSQAESNVANFQSSRATPDIQKASDAAINSSMDNDKQLAQVNVNLEVVNNIEKYVNSPGSASVPSTFGINDPGLDGLISTLSQLEIEHARLASSIPLANPIFEPINLQIKTARQGIMDKIRNIKQSLLAQKRGLETYSQKYTSSLRNAPVETKAFAGLERDKTVKDDLFTYLLKKKEEVKLSYATMLANARLVDSAYELPGNVVKRYAPFGVAMALTFLLPIGIVFGRGAIKNVIIHSKEITKETDVPVLAELSFEKSKTPIVVLDRTMFAIAEEFRTLRTKLHYLHGKTEKGRVTLITSSVSNEGKSFVSSNLAVTIAASGRKTAILEMDLRKPRISAIFDVDDKHPGISNYLNGETTETKIIQKLSKYPNLDVLGSGDFYSNPSELLEQPRMATLIEWLRENYDDIIIDTPPVSIVTDAIIVAKQADVTLYTVRQAYTSKTLLGFIKTINDDQHFPKLNAIFNGVEKGRYGYTGYGYGYGDYITDKKIKKKYSNSIFKDFSKRF
jgi:tyrosine-protein kinase Etk/Wzc